MITNTLQTATMPIGPAQTNPHRMGTACILLPEGVESRICLRLEELGKQISGENPGVRTRAFSSSGGSIYLSCFLELTRSGRNESLIVEIAYRNNLGRFVVMADVCGEESGRFVWERPDVEVNPNDIQQVDRLLQEATEDLVAHSVDSIREALK